MKKFFISRYFIKYAKFCNNPSKEELINILPSRGPIKVSDAINIFGLKIDDFSNLYEDNVFFKGDWICDLLINQIFENKQLISKNKLKSQEYMQNLVSQLRI